MSYAEDEGYDGYDLSEFRKKSSKEQWYSANGEIAISDMTDIHLYYAFRKTDDKRLRREILLRLFAEYAGIEK